MKKNLLIVLVTLLMIFSFCNSSVENQDNTKNLQDDFYKIKVDEVSILKEIDNPINIIDEKPHIEVKIGIYKSVSAGILLLADALGYFEEVGLYPHFYIYPEYSSLVEAFKYNEIDMATIGLYESMMLLLDDIEFLGILPLTYKGITFATDVRSGIMDFSDLKGAKIGLNINSIDYLLLKKGLENTSDLSTDDLILYDIPKEYMYNVFNRSYINGGFFDAFYKPSSLKLNTIFHPSRYKFYKVESLLVNKNYADNNIESMLLLIEGYKKSIAFFNNYRKTSLSIISDENRLHMYELAFETKLTDEPIIEITDNYNDSSAVGYNKDIITNKLFHPNGIYNNNSLELLKFIVNNYDKYNKEKYINKIEEIRVNLLRSRYYTILYLAESGFEEPEVTTVEITKADKIKWASNITLVESKHDFVISSYNFEEIKYDENETSNTSNKIYKEDETIYDENKYNTDNSENRSTEINNTEEVIEENEGFIEEEAIEGDKTETEENDEFIEEETDEDNEEEEQGEEIEESKTEAEENLEIIEENTDEKEEGEKIEENNEEEETIEKSETETEDNQENIEENTDEKEEGEKIEENNDEIQDETETETETETEENN